MNKKLQESTAGECQEMMEIVRKCQRNSFQEKQEMLVNDYALRMEEGKGQNLAGEPNTVRPWNLPRRPLHEFESSISSEVENQELLKAIALHQRSQEATDHGDGHITGDPQPDRMELNNEAPPSRASRPGAYSGEPGSEPTRNEKVRFSRVGVPAGPWPKNTDNDNNNLDILEEIESLPSSNSSAEMPFAESESTGHSRVGRGSSSLAVARAVTGRSHKHLQRATEMESNDGEEQNDLESKGSSPMKACETVHVAFILACGTIFLAGILLLLLLMYLPDPDVVLGEQSGAQPGPTTLVPTERLVSLLPNNTIPKLLFDGETPQGEAFNWLIQDPNFSSYTDKRLRQRFALAVIYFATHGPEWDPGWHNNTPGWLDYTRHECDWDYYMPGGLHYETGKDHKAVDYKHIDGLCHILNTTTTSFSFYSNASLANDSLPVADDITCLALFQRELAGAIPKEITMLTGLKLVQLESTTLKGTIPSTLVEISGLRELHLGDSGFHGSIPTELARLTELRVLEIIGADFTGTLPTQLGLLSNLQDLHIAQTSINGTIPTEYGRLRPVDLQLYRNQLTGTIPTELGLLTTTVWLMLERNQLSGTIPAELGQLEKVLLLYLQENHQLTGTVPTELGLLKAMRQLYLHDNLLSGRIPTELGSTHEILWRLKLGSNLLTGEIPSELGKLSLMQSLGLEKNTLTGTIPEELGEIPSIQYLRVQGNELSGSVMDIFLNSTEMLFFSAQNNHFIGSIPSEIGLSWPAVECFDIGNNRITGTIPSQIGLLKQMKEFHVAINNLTGTIATQLGALLAGNKTALHVFNISDNEGLSGNIPENLCILGDPIHSGFTELGWDCTELLCGCGCPCAGANSTDTVAMVGKNGAGNSNSNEAAGEGGLIP